MSIKRSTHGKIATQILPIKLKRLLLKEQVINLVRQFFWQKNFLEITVPMLQKSLPLEPTLHAFSTTWQTSSGKKTFYLPTSPEATLKKALALGVDNCFAITACFRNLENNGQWHRPEFLMCEWYRSVANYQQIMADLKELILFLKQQLDIFMGNQASSTLLYQQLSIDLSGNWPALSLEKLFKKYAQLEIKDCQELSQLKQIAKQKNYQTANANWEQLFNQIFINEVEPHLPKKPFFLIDFPAKISPLCQKNQQKPYLANRFEFYLAGVELANGNDEEIDAKLVGQKFLAEKKYRLANNLACHAIDEQFLDALEKMQASGQNYAGIGLGLERLVMILANLDSIEQLNFSKARIPRL